MWVQTVTKTGLAGVLLDRKGTATKTSLVGIPL
jgi:hypothetical protein